MADVNDLRLLLDTTPGSISRAGAVHCTANLGAAPRRNTQASQSVLTPTIPHRLPIRRDQPLRHRLRILGRQTLFHQVLLPREPRQVGAQLLHAATPHMPLRAGVPVVATVHDAVTLLFPHCFRRHDALRRRLHTIHALRHADHVSTVSEHSRRDLLRRSSLEPARISVVHTAPTDSMRPATPAAIADMRQRFGLTHP